MSDDHGPLLRGLLGAAGVLTELAARDGGDAHARLLQAELLSSEWAIDRFYDTPVRGWLTKRLIKPN
jgi:hypothetical protein